jgi:Tol biopolymer transport system component
VDGAERKQLTFAPMESLAPRWSPDGKAIAFMGRSPGKAWQIYRIPVEGGPAGPLVPGPEDQANPTWSPDGNVLAYAGAPWQTGFIASSTAIYRLDLRTHQVTTLPDSAGLWSPRWSPDGRYLVAETIDSQGLRIFDLRARQWTSLVQVPGEVLEYTAWSHDSRYVYFNAVGKSTNGIYRVNVEGARRATVVVDLRSLSPAHTAGQWFSLAPDDSPLVAHDTTIREIYAIDVRFP